jgi:hypothetical protein
MLKTNSPLELFPPIGKAINLFPPGKNNISIWRANIREGEFTDEIDLQSLSWKAPADAALKELRL